MGVSLNSRLESNKEEEREEKRRTGRSSDNLPGRPGLTGARAIVARGERARAARERARELRERARERDWEKLGEPGYPDDQAWQVGYPKAIRPYLLAPFELG